MQRCVGCTQPLTLTTLRSGRFSLALSPTRRRRDECSDLRGTEGVSERLIGLNKPKLAYARLR